MKKYVLLFMVFVAVQFISAQTTRTVTITSGKLWQSIAKDDKATIINLTIIGTMDSRDFQLLKDSFTVLKSLNLSNVTITDYNGSGANTIPNNSFNGNTLLTSITLPNNLTTVGVSAFNGCTSITSINFPATLATIDVTSFRNFGGLFTVDANNPAFSADSGVLFNKTQTDLLQSPISLTGSLTIPNTVTTIKTYSFYNCNKVTDVISGNSNPLTIEDYAFYGVTSLINFTTNATTTTIKAYSFGGASKLNTFTANSIKVGSYSFLNSGVKTLTASITEISDNSFYNCVNLTGVNIVSPVSSIPNGAFAYCKSLVSINLPSSVSVINTSFYGCTKLNDVSGSSIKLNDDAFSGCSSLTAVNATITGIGNNVFLGCSKLSVINVSSTLSSIGKSAFEGCIALPQYDVSSTVTSIGIYAFRNCNAQINVDANNPNYSSINGALYDKNATTLIQSPINKSGTFYIPDGVTTVKGYSFYNNTKLTNVMIPASVCTIEPLAFLNCPAKMNIASNNLCLSSSDSLVVYNPDRTVLIFCSQKKSGSYSLPSSVYKINDNAFSGCNLLTNIILNNGLTMIGNNAFENSAINSINIPSTVKKLGVSAFSGCSQVTSLTFDAASNLDSISNACFYNCTKLATVNLPQTVVSIGNSAFNGCSKVTSFPLPQNLKSIGEYAFSGCSSWTGTLNLPNSIIQIGRYAFNACTGLSGALNIPSSMSVISEAAFAYCYGLSSIIIPNTITSIGNYAFYSCRNVATVNIPTSVTSIGTQAFLGCSGLFSIHADAVQPVDLTNSQNVFSGVNKSSCTLFVPAGSKKYYKKAVQWQDFYHIIEGLGFWLAKDTVYVSDIANKDSVFIGSNTNWSTKVINTTWLTSSPATGNYDGKIFIESQENFADKRTGYIEVKTQDSKDTIVVIQRATSKIPDMYIKVTSLNICNHQKYNFKAVALNAVAGALSYNWSFGDGKTATTPKDTINHEYSDMKSTDYDVQVVVSLAPYQRTFSTKFVTDPLPILILDNKPNLCEGDTMIVHVKGADKYFWDNGSKADSLLITREGTYSVQGIKNDTLCVSTTFSVSYFQKYQYTIQVENDEVKSFLPLVHLQVDGPASSSYTWEFEKGESSVEGNDIYYLFKNTDEKTQFVKLIATTPESCKQVYYKVVNIVKSEAPNTFTPNGDGKNDVFLKNVHIQVYDRYGILLYDGTDGWDGTYKGNKMPQDTYYYAIIFKSQSGKKIISNYVMLIR